MQYSAREREMLARTIEGEAGGMDYQGQLAVAAVIANRIAANSSQYGTGLGGVILKSKQFSMWNGVDNEYTNGKQPGDKDPNMAAYRTPGAQAYEIADRILSGNYQDPTGGAVNYYAPNQANPPWGRRSSKWQETATVGGHIFGFAGGAAKPKPGFKFVPDQSVQATNPQLAAASQAAPVSQGASASPLAPLASPRPYVKPEMISPGTPGTYQAPDRKTPHGFAKHDLIIYGGKNGDDFYHGREYKAHDLNHADYSQQFRDWRLFASADQIPEGWVDTGVKRDGKIVAASGRPEYINGKPVSKDGFIREARARGGIIPRYNEMEALYKKIPGVNMPTSGLWGDKVGGVGTPEQYNSFLNPRLDKAGIGPNDPYYSGKEFYLSDTAQHSENWDLNGTGGTPPVYGKSPGPAGPVSNPAVPDSRPLGSGSWDGPVPPVPTNEGVPPVIGMDDVVMSAEVPPIAPDVPSEFGGGTGGIVPLVDSGAKADTLPPPIPVVESNGASGSWGPPTVLSDNLGANYPEPPVPVVDTAQIPATAPTQVQPAPVAPSTPQMAPPMDAPYSGTPIPADPYNAGPVPPIATPQYNEVYDMPIQASPLPPPVADNPSVESTGGGFLAGIGGDLAKMALSGLMGGGGGGMRLPPAPVVQAAPPPRVASGPVMFNIKRKKDKKKNG